MKRAKQTVDLGRFAADAKADRQAAERAAPADAQLERLLANVGRIVLLPPARLVIQDNIRQMVDTDSEEFAKLVASVRRDGVKQNLIGDLRVREDGAWQVVCVAGQRRLLAAREAGREHVPVRLERYADEAGRLVDALGENLLRRNLHSLDTALGYLRLHQAGWSEDQIAEAFERRRDTVMKMLRLARYPAAAHAVIRAHPERFTSTVLLTKFVSRSWPGERELVAALKEFAAARPPAAAARRETARADAELLKWEKALAKGGLAAAVKGSRRRGEVTLRWKDAAGYRALSALLGKRQGN
jgi:ParB/RepB/Spo0J family partition protein